MNATAAPATFDTNIAVYALTSGGKEDIAYRALSACEFQSVQVLNEFANVSRRKLASDWPTIARDIDRLIRTVPRIVSISAEHHFDARRIAARYQLSVYDALMLAVALSGGAKTLYSEDMQHGLSIDDTLRVVDPFR